jgi:hypothetical protein
MKKGLLILLCLPMIGFGQEWTFGGTGDDYGYSVQQTTDGGYIIIGTTESFGTAISNVYLIKTDGNGIEQWSKTFGGPYGDYGSSVQQTTDGGYIITGYTYSFGNGVGDVYLIKTDDGGIEQWSKTFGGIDEDWGMSVQQTSDGGYIIIGYSYSFVFAGNQCDVYLIKTDDGGIEQWSKTFGGTDSDYGYSVQQTTDGGYIIIGTTNSFGNGVGDVYLIKTDDVGIEQWTKTFGGTSNDWGYSVQQTIDGGYIVAGYTYSFSNSLSGSDVYLIKTDDVGIEQWTKTFGGTGYDEGYSVQQTTDGGYVITGRTSSFGNGLDDVYLIKTDDGGIEQWSKTFGGTDYDEGFSVQQTTDGGYIITGYILLHPYSFGNSDDIYLIKTDGNGNVTSTFNIPTPSPNRKLQKTVDILGKETQPQTNIPFIEIYDDGTVEKRIVIE